MSYRDEHEPEYIDDDDYLDGDNLGAGARGAHILGGSGAWRENEPMDDPPENVTARQPQRSASKNRQRTPSKASRRSSENVTTRNPAPSAASSEERRARLAGKNPPSKSRQSQRRQPNEASPAPDEAPQREGQLGGLRARFGSSEAPSEAQPTRGRPRIAAVAAGIGGRVRRLGGRLGGARGRDEAAREDRHRDEDNRLATDSPRASAGSDTSEAPRGKRPRLKIDAAGWLDLDRKLDLIGVALVFGAIVFFVSALSAEQAAHPRPQPRHRPGAWLGRSRRPGHHVCRWLVADRAPLRG